MLNLKLTRPLIFFDIESTGVSPRFDRIIELDAIKVMVDGTEEEKNWLLNPTIPIPEETIAFHHITDDIVKNCPTFKDKAEEIFEFFKDCDLSGYNADRFDIPCLEEEFARCGMNFNSTARKHIDVMRIFHRMEPRNLAAAVKFYCHREHVGAHGAGADTRATLDVFAAQLERYPDLPRDVATMDEYLVPHDPLNADRNGMLRWKDGKLCINFGQKKGHSLVSLLNEENYLKWIVKGDFPTDMRMIVKDFKENGRLPPMPPEARAQQQQQPKK